MENTLAIAYNSFPHGDKVQPLSEEEKECFREVRDVLSKHNKLQRFGVTLLHKHFDIAEDELLVESIDEENRTQTIKPLKKSVIEKMGGQVLQTAWSLQEGSEVIQGCYLDCVTVNGSHARKHTTRGS